MAEKCSDCGYRETHRDDGGMCRRCAEKGGNGYQFITEIDHDKLRAKVGDELAEEIINECGKDY